ncbi:uncharacterized protein LOC128957242 [Oppia nitens]|uniref:uncharacterized protein LOC128957242 n=1 Tax=Oppia nitens TaxID=1686743 RepID=UPI0023DC0B55|nr:uncharacterized protein LOC128957242 [Oppia nitens]
MISKSNNICGTVVVVVVVVMVWPTVLILLLLVLSDDHHIGGGGGGSSGQVLAASVIKGIDCPTEYGNDNTQLNIEWEALDCARSKWFTPITGSDPELRHCCSRVDEIQMRYQLFYKLCTISSPNDANLTYYVDLLDRQKLCKSDNHIDYDKLRCDKQPVDLDNDDCLYYRQKILNETTGGIDCTTEPYNDKTRQNIV